MAFYLWIFCVLLELVLEEKFSSICYFAKYFTLLVLVILLYRFFLGKNDIQNFTVKIYIYKKTYK